MSAPFDLLPFPLPPDQAAAIAQAYATPPRAYHDLHHVGEVLRHYDDVAHGPGWVHPRDVAFAVLYHDAIYVAGAKDNEARSAELAREHLAQWPMDGLDLDRIAQLIELTARHGTLSPDDVPDEDTRRFLDCDMAILGAAPAVFDAYDRGITAGVSRRGAGLVVRDQSQAVPQGAARARTHLSSAISSTRGSMRAPATTCGARSRPSARAGRSASARRFNSARRCASPAKVGGR
jgi:predicted metal-dependent HD superfamily phosphohydrolase